MSDVPDHWFPLLPLEPRPGAYVFRLGHLDGPDGEPLRPQGRLLAPGLPNAYDLFAEEVPREGVTLTRSHQYARTRDGRSVLWTARCARPGRGEAQSGLRFDRTEE
ncbi:hypothetical protein [Streptomyces sp. NPDC012756]|uniref:hypothetical protein n=1 Tax=Streptomyces sp. NPDC012756 TaxID=3364847 RepID=UPI003677992D